MLCPNCKLDMLAATTESKYGEKVFLDQCPGCGGVWCDGEELYLAREVKDDNYAGIDIAKLKEPTTHNEELHCPRDNAVLTVFKDYNFPKSINIQSCPTCQGFWFNRSQLMAFQEDREKKITTPEPVKDPAFDQAMKALLSEESGSAGYQAVGRLGSFLSTPMSQGPGGFSAINSMSPNARAAVDMANVAGGAVSTLLRLFL